MARHEGCKTRRLPNPTSCTNFVASRVGSTVWHPNCAPMMRIAWGPAFDEDRPRRAPLQALAVLGASTTKVTSHLGVGRRGRLLAVCGAAIGCSPPRAEGRGGVGPARTPRILQWVGRVAAARAKGAARPRAGRGATKAPRPPLLRGLAYGESHAPPAFWIVRRTRLPQPKRMSPTMLLSSALKDQKSKPESILVWSA